MKIIKNPVTQYLPAQILKIGTSSKARLVNMKEFVGKLSKNAPVCFVVGGVAKGNPGMEVDYIDDAICISKYPLSASTCLGRILNAFEETWNI